MGRQPCCEKSGLNRGPWTIEEDHKLMTFILSNGIQCWRTVPKLAGLHRCGKSCRLRWINYLRPDLKRGALTEAEEEMIIQLHSRLGNRWSKIAAHFPGRTDNEIKNHWNTRIKKKLQVLSSNHTSHTPLQQYEDCEVKKEGGTMKPESATEQGEIKLELQGTLVFRDPKIPQFDGRFNYGLHEGSNMGPVEIQKADHTTTLFSEEISKPLPEDFLQQWIDSPLPWDFFSDLKEDT
ncbi:hypothetical protein RJ639_008559 [Escallonia herrerae]|uniref:Uncharacterized protein n=1 Tax=Escallonia herrerae TaxID=1293975 RepID=A0AA88VPX8_9ASTE|nr:hypothetical protein RJ639_008559 [Escallonia herrerae]